MVMRKRKKIRRKIYKFVPLDSSKYYWKRWMLDLGRQGFFIWDEPDEIGKYICGTGSFYFGKERSKLIKRIKFEGEVAFGKDIPRKKIE